jgi:nucleotide-binding universal stress UspA family protein
MGSVADLMVREGCAPVLLVRSLSPALSAADTALVPLDGSAAAENALTMVKELAGKPIRRVHLLRAIEAPEEWDGARRYLEGIARGLAGLGLEVTTSVRVDEPAAAIMRTAPRAHLVILSTHGRGGVDRLRHGSVANRIVHQGTIPTLLVRVHAVEAAALSPSLPIAVEFV